MELKYSSPLSSGLFRLHVFEPRLDRYFFVRDRHEKVLTIAWNKGPEQTAWIDEMPHAFPQGAILPLMVNESFRFQDAAQVVAWQFNREFYCVVDHDQEVGCAGFLFYGNAPVLFVIPADDEQQKLERLLQVFIDEFQTADNIQQRMLQMLLVRLVILVTRVARLQAVPDAGRNEDKFWLFRHFNILVENHYRTNHDVAFYAALLHKSPKTLANVFALYGHQSPLQVISRRLLLEAKRLFCYTDKSVKEVAAELGFQDAAHFSRFFRKLSGLPPTDFKRHYQKQFIS